MPEALAATTVVLVAATIALLVAMVVVRIARRWRASRTRRLAEAGIGLLVRVADGETAARQQLVEMDARHWRALAPTALRMLDTVSGQARADVIELFERRGEATAARWEATSRSAARRARAAYTLGLLCHAPALQELHRLLADPDPDVRYSAARALGRIAGPASARPLLAALAGERKVPAHTVGHALLSLGPAAAPALRAAVGDDEPLVRAVAIEVLGRWADYQAVPGLIAALRHDPVCGVRVQAAGALARLGLPQAIAPLLDAAGAQDRRLRAAAARALGELGDPGTAPRLRLLLADPVYEVARDAAQALTALGAAGLAALEQAATDQRSSSAASHARSALALAALRTGDGDARAAAARAE